MDAYLHSPFKKDLIEGKVALLTGGATGIGFGLARALGYHGATLVLMGRREKVLEESCLALKKLGFEAFAVTGDVRSIADCNKAIASTIAQYKKLDILINGAAGNFICSAEDLSPNGFKTVIDIDLNGTFNMSKAAFPYLKQSKGQIINISATLHYSVTPYQIHASAAKAGVDVITRSLAVEWGEYGIRVNGIAPGPIKATEGMSRLAIGKVNEKDLSPVGRAGTVEDIGYTALFLLFSGFINGHTVVVDGGSHLAHKTLGISKEVYTEFQKNSREKQMAQKSKL
eukprot:TRINITY_DN2811_c0_g1_i1.p1 TRINITY_DN2811_c0_g1~~TRINITY_DN2811_c0_g1_i1.p1  ORF type:complete len:299 (+),score=70.03 TRINITY_DN2811_c0_g1_i1:45-899(+)